MDDVDIGWLAGIIDGEGSISMTITNKRVYTPWVTIYNTDEKIILKVQSLLESIGVSKPVHKFGRKNPHHKPSYHIQISKHAEIKLLLDLVVPHLSGKRERAEIMLEFVNARIAANHRGREGPTVSTYDGTEVYYFDKLKELNRRGM